MYIEDINDTKPSNWVEQKTFPDENAVQPRNWNETKEGKWHQPRIKNPKYIGPWTPTIIYNKNYKGPWIQKQILNPNIPELKFEDYKIGGIGIDIWTVKAGTIFDNFLIADSMEEAMKNTEVLFEKQLNKEKEFKEKEEKEIYKLSQEEKEALEENLKIESKIFKSNL